MAPWGAPRDRRRHRHVDAADVRRDRHRERDPREGLPGREGAPGVRDARPRATAAAGATSTCRRSAASRWASGPGCSRASGSASRRRRPWHRCPGVPIVGITSLDALAYAVRYTPRRIAAVIDGRRGEVFSAVYRSVPGGVIRETRARGATPDRLAAELEARARRGVGGRQRCDAVSACARGARKPDRVRIVRRSAHPEAASLVELAVPRFLREEHDRLFDVVPLYLRKSDAEIAWDQRARGAQG